MLYEEALHQRHWLSLLAGQQKASSTGHSQSLGAPSYEAFTMAFIDSFGGTKDRPNDRNALRLSKILERVGKGERLLRFLHFGDLRLADNNFTLFGGLTSTPCLPQET